MGVGWYGVMYVGGRERVAYALSFDVGVVFDRMWGFLGSRLLMPFGSAMR